MLLSKCRSSVQKPQGCRFGIPIHCGFVWGTGGFLRAHAVDGTWWQESSNPYRSWIIPISRTESLKQEVWPLQKKESLILELLEHPEHHCQWKNPKLLVNSPWKNARRGEKAAIFWVRTNSCATSGSTVFHPGLTKLML